MKSFFFFISCLLLYLSMLPCGDKVECNTKVETKIVAASDHQQHNHESEACTPFCACSCCPATSVIVHYNKHQELKIDFPAQKHQLYNTAFISESHFSIWHPPKIS